MITTRDEPVAQATQHRAICPICGEQAIRETTWPIRIIEITSVFQCGQRHAWETKWVSTT